MKKLFYGCACALALTVATSALSETVSGKVVDTDGDSITIQQQNGQEQKLKTTKDTTYRKRKLVHKDKMKHGRHLRKGDTYYKPLLDEDDWVEIIYTPTPDNEWIVEDVIIYDD